MVVTAEHPLTPCYTLDLQSGTGAPVTAGACVSLDTGDAGSSGGQGSSRALALGLGIGLGVSGLLALVGCVGLWVWWWRRSRKASQHAHASGSDGKMGAGQVAGGSASAKQQASSLLGPLVSALGSQRSDRSGHAAQAAAAEHALALVRERKGAAGVHANTAITITTATTNNNTRSFSNPCLMGSGSSAGGWRGVLVLQLRTVCACIRPCAALHCLALATWPQLDPLRVPLGVHLQVTRHPQHPAGQWR